MVTDEIITVAGLHAVPARFRLRLYDMPQHTVFVLTDGARGASLTNLAEDVCTEAWRAQDRPPVEDCVFIEHFGYGGYQRTNPVTRQVSWSEPERLRRILTVYDPTRTRRVHNSLPWPDPPGAFTLRAGDADVKWQPLTPDAVSALIGEPWVEEARIKL